MRDRHAWFELLSSNARTFNMAQDRLGQDEPEINFDGIDMREVDLRGRCLKRVSMRGCRFDREEQVEIAKRGGALLDDQPLIGGGGEGPPTNRATQPASQVSDVRAHSTLPAFEYKRAANGRA